MLLSGGTPMKRERAQAIRRSIILVLCCLVVPAFFEARAADAADKPYQHLVILGDLHLPGKNMEAKEDVIRTINSWGDVDMVMAVGDICEDRGTEDEYAAVKKFFEKLNKPLFPIAGNHDYIYSSSLSPQGRRERGDEASRETKLRRFRETFGLPSIYYSKKIDGYLLVFLSPDGSNHLAEISGQQLDWLGAELNKSKDTPAIIFFHAPLIGTLRDYNSNANKPDYIAQPHEKIHEMLMQNPQVFLWVSGHTHTSPKEESFASPINVYANRVTNIHNTDMNRETIWTNSLFLYPGKIVVKTYQHKTGSWLPDLERTISLSHR
jgi:Icc protein